MINIPQPNLGALASVAGRGGNLSNLGGLGLQAIQQLQAAQQNQQRLALEKMRLQDASGLGLLANNRANRALDQQKYLTERAQDLQGRGLLQQERQMAQRGDQFQQGLDFKREQLAQQGALGAGQLDLEKQKLAAVAQQKELARLLDEKKETIEQKKNFTGYAMYAIQNAKTPEEKQMLRQEILKEAESKGYLSKEKKRKYSQMPLSQFERQIQMDGMALGAVDDYKKMMDAQLKPESKGGKKIYDPETGKLIFSSEPTSTNTTRIQEDISEGDKKLQVIRRIKKKIKKEFLTYKGQVGANLAAKAEKASNIPIIGSALDSAAGYVTGKNKEERSKFLQSKQNFANEIGQMFMAYKKEITGVAARPEEVEDLKQIMINEDMSESEIIGAMNQLIEKSMSEQEASKKTLRQGIDISPKILTPEQYQFLRSKGRTDEQIKADGYSWK